MRTNIEIEQRYKVSDVEGTILLLAQHGVNLLDEQHIIDRWFIPKEVHTRKQHDSWFDHEHGVAYRIRSVIVPDNASPNIVLDSKQHTTDGNHNTFKEDIVMDGDEAAMLRFLSDKDYYNWLTIDKKRRRFSSPNSSLEIVMDSVAGVKHELGLDTVLELEYKGDASRTEALAIIDKFARILGLPSSVLFKKSLTVEAMRVLSQFQ